MLKSVTRLFQMIFEKIFCRNHLKIKILDERKECESDWEKCLYQTTIGKKMQEKNSWLREIVLKVSRDKAKGTSQTVGFLFYCCYWKGDRNWKRKRWCINQSSIQLFIIRVFFRLRGSCSWLANNKLTSVPDLTGPRTINSLWVIMLIISFTGKL